MKYQSNYAIKHEKLITNVFWQIFSVMFMPLRYVAIILQTAQQQQLKVC
jgi:hypothetical protein